MKIGEAWLFVESWSNLFNEQESNFMTKLTSIVDCISLTKQEVEGLSPGNLSCVTKQSRDFSRGQNSHTMVVIIESDK